MLDMTGLGTIEVSFILYLNKVMWNERSTEMKGKEEFLFFINGVPI